MAGDRNRRPSDSNGAIKFHFLIVTQIGSLA